MSALLRLGQAAQWMDAARLHGAAETEVLRVHTDTRSIAPGDLFVALRGERFDANTLLAEARASGAVAAVCHAGCELPDFPCITVPDTLLALGQLARAWRAQFDLPLIAVTGSNGKTTVTQMLASILEAHAPGAALATRGNLNNDIGVPLTLLRLRASHRIAVVELGMNHPGEIAALAALAQPTMALVNNAQREHLEFMHSVQAVAAENGAVLTALGPRGVAVFPGDDAFTALWHTLAGSRAVRCFGAAAVDSLVCQQADWVQGAWQVQALGPQGPLRYRLAIAGRHNVRNSLAAATCALAAGVAPAAVEAGLQAFVPVQGRSRALSLAWQGRECTVVDDSYNANPDSVRAAIAVLAELPGPRLLVLGDMGEVGAQGPEFHAEVGAYAQVLGIERLLTLGTMAAGAARAFGAGAQHCATIDELIAATLAAMPASASVLVKGSRFMRMERVVQALQAQANKGEDACC